MKNTQRGFTLIEILVAMFLIAVVSFAIFKIYNNTLRSGKIEQDFLNMQQNLRASLFVASRDIRMAGYAGEYPKVRVVGITAADSTTITYTLINDLDGIDNDGDKLIDHQDLNDGDISEVSYGLMDIDADGRAEEFCRVVDGNTEEIASGIELVEFRYTCTDALGATTVVETPSTAQLSENQIESIQITLVAVGSFPDRRLSDSLTYGVTPGNTTITSVGKMHRQIATTRIFCRNIN